MKFCECGCYELIPNEDKRGEPLKYKLNHHLQILNRQTRSEETIKKMVHIGEKHGMWKGGIKHHSEGYIYIWEPHHPFATKYGYVMEHRLVMEKSIGRYLTEDEAVHHKNGIKTDNRFENLQLLTNSEHATLHNNIRWSGK